MSSVRSSSRNYFQVRLDTVLRHIVCQPADGLDVSDLADIAGYSRCHFSRLAKSALGEDISTTARRVRLESVAYRMSLGSSVKDAALAAGYENPEVLSRSFKTAFGVAPRSFRVANRDDWRLQCANGVHWSPDARLNEYRVVYDGEWNSIVKRPRKRYAYLRQSVECGGVKRVWEDLRRIVPEKLWDDQDVRFITVYHDDFRLRVDGLMLQAGIEIPENYLSPPGLSVESTSDQTYIATIGEVPLDEHSATWRKLIKRWSSDDDKGTDSTPGLDEHPSFPRLERGIQTRMFYALNT